MKTITLILLLGLGLGTSVLAVEENPVQPVDTAVPAAAEAPTDPAPEDLPPAAVPTEATPAPAPPPEPVLLPNGEPGLRLNFREAPLDLVLDYLSQAAGFIIVLETKVTGKIDAWSNQPLSKDEAVDLLNTVLNRNGYAAIRHDRTLTIVKREDAKTRDIPVVLESDPARIPKTDEMVTQIIPVRYVEVAQLLKDLQPLVSLNTTITANEAGNSIIITDTRANINRVAQIIQAIDTGAEDVMELRVFHLEFADPTEMATLLSGVFPDDTRNNNQIPFRFGGRGFRGFGGGGNEAGGSGTLSDRVKKRARVVAVADQRTSSVIVTASAGMMGQIEEMIRQLDANPAKKQKVYVYQVDPGDVSQIQQVLEDMFETTSNNRNSRNNSSLQNNVLQNRATQNQQSGTGNTRNNTTRGNTGFGNQTR